MVWLERGWGTKIGAHRYASRDTAPIHLFPLRKKEAATGWAGVVAVVSGLKLGSAWDGVLVFLRCL